MWECLSLPCSTQIWNTVAESDLARGPARAGRSGEASSQHPESSPGSSLITRSGDPCGQELLLLCLWVKAELQELSSPVLFQEAGGPWEGLEVAARPGRLLNAGWRWHLESPLIERPPESRGGGSDKPD